MKVVWYSIRIIEEAANYGEWQNGSKHYVVWDISSNINSGFYKILTPGGLKKFQ